MAQGVRVKVNSVENQKNDGNLSPERIGHTRSAEGNSEGIEIRVRTSWKLLGTCTIWYKGLPLWHLVTRVMGIRV